MLSVFRTDSKSKYVFSPKVSYLKIMCCALETFFDIPTCCVKIALQKWEKENLFENLIGHIVVKKIVWPTLL